MGSTFGGLEIGKRGLTAHQLALNTAGHNISNADNPHYARQRVTMESMDPLYDPSMNRAQGPGQIGQGVRVARVERIRDAFYDDQINNSNNSKEFWDVSRNYLYQMEKIFNEPAENTLRTLTNEFWASWQELANFPSEHSHREVVLERARGLTTRINDIHNKLTELRFRAENELTANVERINSLAGEIRDLNERILKIETLGDEPNDLKDRRDRAVEELSGLVDINVGRGDKDELIVFIGEQALVQGEVQRKLKLEKDPRNEGFSRLVWNHNNRDVILEGGRIRGLLDMRDRAITERIDKNNLFALNISDIVNEIHRDGFGLNGQTNLDFFNIKDLSRESGGNFRIENASGNFDLNGDGTAEITAIFRATGTNTIDPERRIGINGSIRLATNDAGNTPVIIDYRADDSLNDIIRRINDSHAGVVAYMNHDNQLALKATEASDDRRTNFMIRHIEDSGELLVGYAGLLQQSGEAGAFDFRRTGEISKFRAPLQDITLTPEFHPAGHIEVSNDILHNPASLAAGRGEDVGGTGDYNTAGGMADGRNALLIASAMKQGNNMIGKSDNPEQFYNALVSRLGTESRTAEDAVKRIKDDLTTLNNLRQSVMGVNLDEEMSNMVQFQHGYNAAARIINTVNEMLGIIMGLGRA